MTGWTLFVDCKEPKAEAICEDLRAYSVNAEPGNREDWLGSSGTPVEGEVRNLSIADYWFVKDGKVWAIIERKTVSDMVASIQDDRYKDQAARMLKSEVPFKYYLIVGDFFALDGPVFQKVWSALTHLQMHTQMGVMCAPKPGYVTPFLVRFYQYLADNPTPEHLTAPLVEQIQVACKKRKMDNQKNVYLTQLSVISGMSEDKAKAILELYKDMPTLIRAYESCKRDWDRKFMLKDIQVKKTKIGPVLSERIYSCIMNVEIERPEKKKKAE